ncbi:hypothetical protein AB3S75_045141 [Citrus x aurantiifolia]
MCYNPLFQPFSYFFNHNCLLLNGFVCNTPQTTVDPAKGINYINGKRLPNKLPPKVYIALNKPKGYIFSVGEKEVRSVISLFDDYLKSWAYATYSF